MERDKKIIWGIVIFIAVSYYVLNVMGFFGWLIFGAILFMILGSGCSKKSNTISEEDDDSSSSDDDPPKDEKSAYHFKDPKDYYEDLKKQ